MQAHMAMLNQVIIGGLRTGGGLPLLRRSVGGDVC